MIGIAVVKTNEKKMTVKEVAESMGVSTDTVKNCIRRIFPNLMQNGKATYLNEEQVSYISKELKSNTSVNSHLTYEVSSQVKNTTTELEVIGNAMKAMQDLQNLYNQKEAEYKAIIKNQNKQLIEQKPKVEFFDTVADSKDAIPMSDVAKLLCNKGYKIGRNRLFELLRNKHILDIQNVPYQKYVDADYFRVIEQKYMRNNEPCVNIKTLVYQKGIDFIIKQVKGNLSA